MGKTPKKAAPEGDERNRYVRRLKNSSSTSRQDDITANLTAARSIQPEYENTNRGKPTATHVHKNLKTTGSSKNFKSKLRSPVVKSSLTRLPKSTTNKPVSTEKEASKTPIPTKVFKHKTFVMQPKSEEFGGGIESQTTENIREECVVDDAIVIIKSKRVDTIQSGGAGSEKNHEETEMGTNVVENNGDKVPENFVEADLEEGDTENQNDELKLQLIHETISEIFENEDSKEETEEHEVKLNLTMEDSPLKVFLKEELNGSDEYHATAEDVEQLPEQQKENGHATEDKNDQSEDFADTESCSVDVVESTTSETSETSEPAQTESDKILLKEVPNQLAKDDVSFVSFDASIMLKDVQVRLNDYRKDNSQLFEVTNDERSISEPSCKDSSFGRTLRNISGRHSINRMRHVTLRSRMSPNNSLFVNMSSVSLPDDDVRDHKILRHRTGLSTTLTCNGTPTDRKRKLEPEISSEAKKVKTSSENSLLNTSIGILQGLRRPIQVSTPNIEAYKFKPEKLDISGIDNNEDKVGVQEESGIARKWCSVM